ncbi:MAG: exopolysaccharide Pel transporter PelG [Chloroflexota bacterium]|nr:exopolysaccharide Pel transporter PelG [Chloroflexota bacterium]
MGAIGIRIKHFVSNVKTVDANPLVQSLLFIVPPVVTTVFTYLLFLLMEGNISSDMQRFAITIIMAVVVSLVGTAGVQIVVSKIVGDALFFKDKSMIAKGIRTGLGYCLVFSIIASAGFYYYYIAILDFPIFFFSCFAALLVFFSVTWVCMAALSTAKKYMRIALITTSSYTLSFALALGLSYSSSELALLGYSVGILEWALLALFLTSGLCGGELLKGRWLSELAGLPAKMLNYRSMVLFHTLYIVAIFMDKVIIWVMRGTEEGIGLSLDDPYTTAAFLGMIPLFAVAGVAYFSLKVQPLVDNLYRGTLSEIQTRAEEYKRLFARSITRSMITGLIIGIVVVVLGHYVLDISGTQDISIVIATSFGSICFVGILLNSTVLSLFGRFSITAWSVAVACLVQVATITFMGTESWLVAWGFLMGGCTGFIISFIAVNRLFREFDYNIFRSLVWRGSTA